MAHGIAAAAECVAELLRCSICYDFLETAMMLPCHHVFCSLCIRRSLSYKPECPACRTAASEGDLRNNRFADNIVKTWQNVADAFVNVAESKQDVPVDASPERKRRTKRARTATAPTADPAVPVSSSSDGVLPSLSSSSPSISSAAATPRAAAAPSLDGTAVCPVCGVAMVAAMINSHLDLCLRNKEGRTEAATAVAATPTAATSSSGASSNNIAAKRVGSDLRRRKSRRKRLGKTVYSIMTDRQIRALLKEHDLPTHGTRTVLVRRHKEFVLLYNADLDSDSPRSSAELRRLVMANEAAATAATRVSSLFGTAGKPAASGSAAAPAASAPAASHTYNAEQGATIGAGADDVSVHTSGHSHFAVMMQRVQAARSAKLSARIEREQQRVFAWLRDLSADQGDKLYRRGWRCVWSDEAHQPFFFHPQRGIGQFGVPGDSSMVCDDCKENDVVVENSDVEDNAVSGGDGDGDGDGIGDGDGDGDGDGAVAVDSGHGYGTNTAQTIRDVPGTEPDEEDEEIVAATP